MGIVKKKWIIQPQLPRQKLLSLSRKLSLSPLFLQLLFNREIDEENIRSFLHPCVDDLYDPFLMKGMDQAVTRLIQAIKKKEKVLVYGDYDVDGITATSLLLLFLRQVGLSAFYYIPHRQNEGYGLNRQALDKALRDQIQLIVTCDCGVSSLEEVEYAFSRDIEVIITDHHRVETVLPPWLTVLNPQQPDCSYPFKELAGVGIAFKLCQAVALRLGLPSQSLLEYLGLVALGTVADVVPLREENRILVKLGLEQIQVSPCPGLRALINVSGLSGKKINETHLGFTIAPPLNACGRLSLAQKGVKLFLSSSTEEVFSLARTLNQENRKRRSLQRLMCREAEGLIPAEKNKVMVVSRPNWHVGLLGLVASYLKGKYFCPALVFSLNGQIARGSARSILGFPIFQALEKCQDLLLDFGGHKMAAGMTLYRDNIVFLEERLNSLAAETLSEKDVVPSLIIEARVDLEDLTESFGEELKLLSPYGPENPLPHLLAEEVYFSSPESKRRRVRLTASSFSGKKNFPAVGFGFPGGIKKIPQGEKVEVVFVPQVGEGQDDGIELRIKDFQGGRNGEIGQKN